VVTSDTLVLVLLESREHAHGMLLVSVLVSEVELKLSNIQQEDNSQQSLQQNTLEDRGNIGYQRPTLGAKVAVIMCNIVRH
jgi:hypothetical protein